MAVRGAGRVGLLLWIFPVALVAVLAVIFYGALTRPSRVAPEVPKVEMVESGGFPLTIVEDGGRKVVIPTKPMRIVAANAGAADVMAALVESSRIAGVPGQVIDFSGAPEFYKQHTEIVQFQKFNVEEMLGLKPDLILTATFQNQETIAVLEGRGVPVLRFEFYKTFDGIRKSLRVFGQAVGENEKTDALIKDFDARLKAVETAIAGRKRPRVLSYSNYGKGYAVGTGESQDEIMQRAGAVNAMAELKLAGHVEFSFEQMLALDPDVIIVGGEADMGKRQENLLLNEPSLRTLRAVRERRIVSVPDRYYSTVSQYVVDAVEILARQLHPDAFPAASKGTAP